MKLDVFILNYNLKFTDQIISEKTGSVNYMLHHVIIRKKFSQSKVRMIIRLTTKFYYPMISKIFKLSNWVSKLHFLV